MFKLFLRLQSWVTTLWLWSPRAYTVSKGPVWTLSAFMGLCMIYYERGVEQDLFSCFILHYFFVYLANKNSSPCSDAKLGKYREDEMRLWTIPESWK